MNNFDDVSLAIKTLEYRASMQEVFIARLIKNLISNGKLKPSELIAVIESLEADYPYPQTGATFDNTALRYLCHTIFDELPDLQTVQYKRYCK